MNHILPGRVLTPSQSKLFLPDGRLFRVYLTSCGINALTGAISAFSRLYEPRLPNSSVAYSVQTYEELKKSERKRPINGPGNCSRLYWRYQSKTGVQYGNMNSQPLGYKEISLWHSEAAVVGQWFWQTARGKSYSVSIDSPGRINIVMSQSARQKARNETAIPR